MGGKMTFSAPAEQWTVRWEADIHMIKSVSNLLRRRVSARALSGRSNRVEAATRFNEVIRDYWVNERAGIGSA